MRDYLRHRLVEYLIFMEEMKSFLAKSRNKLMNISSIGAYESLKHLASYLKKFIPKFFIINTLAEVQFF